MICISCGTQFSPPGECPECHWDADAVLSPDSICKPGDVLDSRFAIIGHLGSGRFGLSVWATDLNRKQDVVLNFIHPAFLPTPPHYKRFIDGISLLTDNAHNATAKILDVDMIQRRVFVSNEYLDGGTLADLIAQRTPSEQRFTVGEIYPVLKEVASSLVESPTMFHGAICPDNIFIQAGQIKVTECGLAANLPEAVVMHRLASNPERNRYVAPEIQSATGLSARSDVYAIGVILAEMLSLKRFNPQRFSGVAADLDIAAAESPGLAEILQKALATNPKDRFRDAEALLIAISDTAALPAPRFNRSWADGLAAEDGETNGTQEDRTAQIVMKDVIQQHYDEVTAVGRNPLLAKQKSSPKAPPPPKPTSTVSKENEQNMSTSEPPADVLSKPSNDSAAATEASMPQRNKDAASPVIDLDDTMEDLPDITDEFEVLEEEMLQEVDGPEFKNLETGKNESNDAPSSWRSRIDSEKTVNERGYLLMNENASIEKETSETLRNPNEEAGVSGNPSLQAAAEAIPEDDASLDGINPRFLRAAQKLASEQQPLEKQTPDEAERSGLEDINPRFLRAAKTLKESGQTGERNADAPSPFETNDTEDWRSRLSQELAANEESMVSFLPVDATAENTVDQNSTPIMNKPRDVSASSRRATSAPPPPPVSGRTPAKPPTLKSRRAATPPPPPPVRKP